MIARFSAWVNTVNTTSLRIIASIGGAIFCISNVLLAMLWRNWIPDPMQYKVLIGIAGVLLTMMGFDVIQFIGKRFSAAQYVAAKSGAESGSSVLVQSTTPLAPTVEVTAAPVAEKGEESLPENGS
jgi:hypothetical protein